MNRTGVLLCICLIFVGCGKVTSYVRPGINLSDYNSAYIQHNPKSRSKDGIRDVDFLLQSAFKEQGYATRRGEQGDDVSDFDVVVNYTDLWNWDMSMYLYHLEVTVHDTDDNSLLARGEYRQNKFFHWYPNLEKTVNEVVNTMINNTGTNDTEGVE